MTDMAPPNRPQSHDAASSREFMASLVFTLWLAFFGTLIGYLIYVAVTA